MVNDEITLKKDIVWTIAGHLFKVKNVPYSDYEDGEDYFSIGVSAKLAILKELMLLARIPRTVDFDDFTHLKF